ncbi:MAG: thiamine pyrophosphate-binding protein [Bryobacterales bacterium]|nr:thiamine pyrophosphate-binding protein [Bryobacterales bacterium]
MTAAQQAARWLKGAGVEWIATLCGHGLDPLFAAARDAGLRLIDARNEQTAAYIADTAGRLTGRPGVCAVSSGLAHVNALSGVANAWFDGAPMLLISGSAAVETAGMGHFQDLDQVALARPITRYARVIDCASRTTHILNEAWEAACGPVPGPVHLTFPMDIQNAEVRTAIAPVSIPRGAAADDPAEAAGALARAERPLLIAGSGLHYSGHGAALLRFAEAQSIPVVTPIWDRGVVPGPSPVFQGVLGAATGGPRLLPDADCMVLAGAVNDYRTGYLQPDALAVGVRVVSCDLGWNEMAAAYDQAGGRPHTAWLAEARRRRDAHIAAVRQRGAEQAQAGQHAIDLMDALEATLSDDAMLLIDGGSIGQWAHQLLATRYPGHWLTCGRSGVVGWGLGGAMGARLVYPERPVVLLSGDGSFTFNVAEIECAVRQSLHFVAIVADDLGWGITRLGHVRQFGSPISSSLGPIAFDQLAVSLGARGQRVERREELAPAIAAAMREPAVTVLHVPIVGGNP